MEDRHGTPDLSAGKETVTVNAWGGCDNCGFNQTIAGDSITFTTYTIGILTNWSRGNDLKESYGSAVVKLHKAHSQHNPNCKHSPRIEWTK